MIGPSVWIYRVIGIIALIQAGVAIYAPLFLAAIFKFYGYGFHNGVAPYDFFHPAAWFVRDFGFAFLLVPLLWTVATIAAARTSRLPPVTVALLVLGIAAVPAALIACQRLATPCHFSLIG